MTGFWRGEEEEIIRLQLTPTVWEPGQVELLEKATAAHDSAGYQEALKVLGKGADRDLRIVEGVE